MEFTEFLDIQEHSESPSCSGQLNLILKGAMAWSEDANRAGRFLCAIKMVLQARLVESHVMIPN